MAYKRARTDEQIQERRNDIVNSAISIYNDYGYDALTLRKIEQKIKISRSSIYNYFCSKEEILLFVIKNEYNTWINEIESEDVTTDENLINILTNTLESRTWALQLMSTELSRIENNVKYDILVDFKKIVKLFIDTLLSIVEQLFPNQNQEDYVNFVSSFMIFSFGIDQYTRHSDIQIEAMGDAGIIYNEPNLNKIATRHITSQINMYFKK